uniref:Carbonic anhydrase n=1 Tax=Xenopus tropicalis TaxID=8364 RepID=A0A803JV11_XENTR
MSRRHDWGYASHNGPDTWAEYFPAAKGDQQSPIELLTRYIKHDPTLRPWTSTYHPSTSLTVVNDGTTCRVVFDDSTDKSVIKDGPMNGTYRLRQLQFHWGSSDDHGSEHVIDGFRYAGEMHFIHWNSKYDNITEAKKHPDGVAIIAVFLKVGEAHPGLQKVLDALKLIPNKGNEAPFTDYDPSVLLPNSLDFWNYKGSLTTPPLLQCVLWHVLREPIAVSNQQLSQLRSLFFNAEGDTPCCMVDNFRPPQPLKSRHVRASFQ